MRENSFGIETGGPKLWNMSKKWMPGSIEIKIK